MNWMYTDIWPSGSWSVIDYWCEPKQAYYQMKRSYEPKLITFVQNGCKSAVTDYFTVNFTNKIMSVAV